MSERLRLDRVRVKNLFGRFSYDINFENGYNIAILIAPNGCGKTTVFKLINFIFRPSIASYRNIINIPFEFCECTLSNGKVVTLKRKVTSNSEKEDTDLAARKVRSRAEMMLGLRTSEDVDLTLSVKGAKSSINLSKEIRNILAHMDPDLPFIDDDFLDELDIEDLEMMSMPSRLRMQLSRSSGYLSSVRDFLAKNECDLAINFIRADRLHLQGLSKDSRYYRMRGYELPDHNPLVIIQNKTKKTYKDIVDEYNSLQREMKDRLPRLYLDSTGATMSKEQFVQRWEAYVLNIKKYCEIGLLTSEQTILDLDELQEAYDKRAAFLTVYLEAFEKTLEPLERNYTRLKLFVDILNRRNRVTRKIIKYGEEGVVVTVDGQPLPLDCLSSGEKNDFIMFYNLIFDSEENGLVLVDEPEISLHIEWQEEYLDCLLNICEMNDLQAVIATHSPNIVNGHFELYAERGLTDGC